MYSITTTTLYMKCMVFLYRKDYIFNSFSDYINN